ncbi:MAG: ester cyclase [Chitinophagaceae bacterium]
MEQVLQQARMIEMKDACVQFMLAYQKKDIHRMLSFCELSGDAFFKPLGDAGKGYIGELGKGLWNSLMDCFPDINNTVDAIVSEGDMVRCQVLISGTQKKDFAGIENKGKHFDSDHIFIFHLNEKNKIDNITISWDHADLCRQLTA